MLKVIKKYVSRQSFVSALHEIKQVLTLNKSVYLKFSILDLSKLSVYELHFNYIKKNTVLINCLQTQIVWFMKSKQMMFMKIFLKIRICLISVIIQKIERFLILSKKVVGKMKNEFKEKSISEFVGLKSKMHFLIDVDNKEN